MAAQDNLVTVTGNLTRDPEMKISAAGNSYTNGSVAWNQSKRVGDDWESTPHYFDFTCFGDLAERVAGSCSKGDRITLVGRLNHDRWQTDEGENRSKVVILADEVSASMRWADVKITKVGKDGNPKSVSSSQEPFASTAASEEPF